MKPPLFEITNLSENFMICEVSEIGQYLTVRDLSYLRTEVTGWDEVDSVYNLRSKPSLKTGQRHSNLLPRFL